jgi:N-methylhydantoinase A
VGFYTPLARDGSHALARVLNGDLFSAMIKANELMTNRVERLAFDIGGTFTDVIVLMSDGQLKTGKVLSLLDTIGADIRETFELNGESAGEFIHGTTVAANAMLEEKWARIAFITTKGFRDVLEMRGQRRPNVYDMNWTRSKPLVPRDLRVEVQERVLADGSVETELTEAEINRVSQLVVEKGADAIAVCLINSYANPEHEKRVRDALLKSGISVPISISSDGFSEMREYERSSTTAVNAALMPEVDGYLTRLIAQLNVPEARLQVMQSNGGLINAGAARRRPVQIIESGPAAGVLAAARLAAEAQLPRALAFDMGGTTAKATLIDDGVPLEKPGGEVGGGANLASRFFGGSGHAIRVPSIDIAEVGAGGGSLVWIDRGGALRVGPEGAGARPGPICYGRGGTRATVTDANVVLGRMNPKSLAGGTIPIDAEAAARAISQQVAEPLGLSLLEAAEGILRVANATTMRALRAVSIERGVDPRQLTMIAFGGSGPVHACELASTLGIGTVYVPPFPGIFSALGLLLADFRQDAVRSFVMPLAAFDGDVLVERFEELEVPVKNVMADQGIARGDIVLTREIDVQYRGHDAPVPVAMPAGDGDLAAAIERAFQASHRSSYGYAREEAAEIIALRIRGQAKSKRTTITELALRTSLEKRPVASVNSREACLSASSGLQKVTGLDRSHLDLKPVKGPLIIEEWDTSTVIPADWNVRRDDLGNIIISRGV